MKLTFKAFTLIEVLVSLWIITVAILGPLAVAINSSSASRDTKDIVISSYLAQEAFELLRFSRDTIFLKCIGNDPASCVAIPIPVSTTTPDYENGQESAWRLFKEAIATTDPSNKSCFVSQNANGCTYDIEGFLTAPAALPTIFSAAGVECALLNRDTRRQDGITGSASPTDGMYLCSDHSGNLSPTSFKRTVKITSIPSILPNVPGSYDELYNDDLRIEVTISYSKTNLLIKKVKTVDFIRARI